MKKLLVILLISVVTFSLIGCSKEEEEGVLKTKDLYGTYQGQGTVTKEEVAVDRNAYKGKYLMMPGDISGNGNEFSNVLFDFEESFNEDENEMHYSNHVIGVDGSLIYNSSTDQWEGRSDYPSGDLLCEVKFSKIGNEIHAKVVWTQSYFREHFENPDPTDGVNEITMELIKIK